MNLHILTLSLRFPFEQKEETQRGAEARQKEE